MIKRRKFVRIVSYLLALCVTVAAAGGFSGNAKGAYEETLEKVRFEALVSLCGCARELSGGLSLLSVSQGDAVADSAGYVGARAAGAISSAACFDSKKTENINAFLEAAYDLSQSFSGNEQSRKRAAEFSDYAEELYYHLSDLSTAVMGGKYSLSEYGSAYSPNKKPYFENYLDFKTELSAEEEAMQTDSGHFSVLNGKETVPISQMKKRASEITGVEEALWRTSEREKQNDFEVYILTHGDTAVEICKSGGALCRLVNPMPYGKAVYSARDLLRKAEKFIKGQGYDAGRMLGYSIHPFTADFYFVPEVNGVLLMTAHIDISVCLSSGEITFFDASEYIKNYRWDIRVSAEIPDLEGILSDTITVEKSYVCIADIDGRERLCYLAVCPFNGGKVWAYIDYFRYEVIKMQKIPLLIQFDMVY